MYNILFICYGNICRSPMAEMIFKDLVYQNNKRYKFSCASRATSIEELGNDIYPQAKEILLQNNITVERHRATLLTKDDYQKYDFFIAMEKRNINDILNIIGEDIQNKIHLLLEYTSHPKDIIDPWYSGDFSTAYQEISQGCQALFNYLLTKKDETLTKNNEIFNSK